MVFLETALDSKLNPLVALGRSGSMGLSGFVNKFNADAELLDDLVGFELFDFKAGILTYSCRTTIGPPRRTRRSETGSSSSCRDMLKQPMCASASSPATSIALRPVADARPASFLEPAGFLLHHWQPDGMITHLVPIGTFPGPFPFA